MILTEAEAQSKKSCCASRTDPRNCIGSGCMAWRWKEETCNANGIDWKGYCGLAGKPEVN